MSGSFRLPNCLSKHKLSTLLLAVAIAGIGGLGAGHVFMEKAAFSICIVDGPSMMPTFQPGARIRTIPAPANLQRGDVVLVEDPGNDYVLKRIVGMPRETVLLWHGHVYVNRMLLQESYLPKFTYTFPDKSCSPSVFELGENQYLVLGDNRFDSIDSRSFGPVEQSRIKREVPLPNNAPRARLLALTFPAYGRTPAWMR